MPQCPWKFLIMLHLNIFGSKISFSLVLGFPVSFFICLQFKVMLAQNHTFSKSRNLVYFYQFKPNLGKYIEWQSIFNNYSTFAYYCIVIDSTGSIYVFFVRNWHIFRKLLTDPPPSEASRGVFCNQAQKISPTRILITLECLSLCNSVILWPIMNPAKTSSWTD